jgi:exosortase A
MTEQRILSLETQETPIISSPPEKLNLWRRPVFLLLACSAAALISFRHTLFLMVETWSQSRTYSHCFLVIPIFAYLIWHRRRDLPAIIPTFNKWGLLVVAALAFIWVVGDLAEVKLVQELAVISLLIALAWTFLGTAVSRTLAFPFFFLFFAVPFGTSLIRPLQDITAWLVINALNLSRVPAVLEDHLISLPNGVWKVAEACSGIRFLLSSVVMGSVFSFVAYRSQKRRLIFMCASIALPIIGNGLRAYGTILLAYLTNNQLAVGVDHVVYGGFFAVFLQLVLMSIGLRWRESPRPTDTPIFSRRPISRSDQIQTGRMALFAGVALVAIICATPLFAGRLWNKAAIASWAEPPVLVMGPWHPTVVIENDWGVERHGADKEFSQSYKRNNSRVDLNFAEYGGRQKLEFGARPDGLGSAHSWVVDSGTTGSAIVDGHQIQVNRRLLQSGAVSRTVWTWYLVSGEYTADQFRVRLLQAKARLLGNSASVAVISLGSDDQGHGHEAEEVLREFLRYASFPSATAKRANTQQAKLALSSHIDEDSGTVP